MIIVEYDLLTRIYNPMTTSAANRLKISEFDTLIMS
jgi:hypothetical protein